MIQQTPNFPALYTEYLRYYLRFRSQSVQAVDLPELTTKDTLSLTAMMLAHRDEEPSSYVIFVDAMKEFITDHPDFDLDDE